MSLEYAILGLLDHMPFSGYDLKKVFDTSIRHFWPANQTQIYLTLNRLAGQGLVEMEVVEQTERPDRKVYHITEAGRSSLRQWLVASKPAEMVRSARLIQVFFAAQLSDEEILHIFEELAAQVREALRQYESIPNNIEAYNRPAASSREFYFWMLTLEVGKTVAAANLAWIESVISRIRNGELPRA
jgi:PadR family transcriptional regulator, regulatory protein AphA